jgi:GT2 family glycosyltransferase
MTANSNLSRVSVIIPTHNPRGDYLARVIDALKQQTLSPEQWELLVVDNASKEMIVGRLDLSWHPHARIVREERLGLTFARLRGFAEAKGELIVMVDDDNVLAPDYLESAVRIAQAHPELGAFGGKCLPEFEVKPEPWLASVTSGLGLRDRGEREEFFPEAAVCEASVSEGQFFGRAVQKPELLKNRTAETPKHRVTRRVTEFPDCAPIGAGMVLRRDAAAAYAERIEQRTTGPRDHGTITDRKGDSLASGGDNDICLTALEQGWQVGYLPQLTLTHLIPAGRMTLDYQRRMARDAMKSFILMLDQHGIRPWPAIPSWSVPLRVAKDYFRVQPWRGPERSLKWCMNRGRYEACGKLAAKTL